MLLINFISKLEFHFKIIFFRINVLDIGQKKVKLQNTEVNGKFGLCPVLQQQIIHCENFYYMEID